MQFCLASTRKETERDAAKLKYHRRQQIGQNCFKRKHSFILEYVLCKIVLLAANRVNFAEQILHRRKQFIMWKNSLKFYISEKLIMKGFNWKIRKNRELEIPREGLTCGLRWSRSPNPSGPSKRSLWFWGRRGARSPDGVSSSTGAVVNADGGRSP